MLPILIRRLLRALRRYFRELFKKSEPQEVRRLVTHQVKIDQLNHAYDHELKTAWPQGGLSGVSGVVRPSHTGGYEDATGHVVNVNVKKRAKR